MDTSRYQLIQVGERFILLSNTSYSILEFLSRRKEAYYQDIVDYTNIPKTTLYAFCQRLENSGLIKRTKGTQLSGNFTLIKLTCHPVFKALELVR